MGKARDAGHESQRSSRDDPVVPVDYANPTSSDNETRRVLVGCDDHIKCVGVWVVPSKDDLPSASQRPVQWIKGAGHGNSICKSEREPSIVDLQEGAKRERLKLAREL